MQHLPPETGLNTALDEIKAQLREERPPAPPAPRAPVSLPERIQLEVADAADLPVPDGMFDLIVTSPPYGLGISYANTDDDQGYSTYIEFAQAWAASMFRVAAPQGRLCLNVPLDVTRGGQKAMYADWLNVLREAGWNYQTTIVWNEGNTSRQVARGSPDSPSSPHVITPVEMIIVMGADPAWNLHRSDRSDLEHDEWLQWTNGLWTFPGASNPKHPSPFPEELPRRCIKLFSFPDDLVLDPFVGSGTTAVVAARLGRQFYGFDHSEEYIANARERVARELRGGS